MASENEVYEIRKDIDGWEFRRIKESNEQVSCKRTTRIEIESNTL